MCLNVVTILRLLITPSGLLSISQDSTGAYRTGGSKFPGGAAAFRLAVMTLFLPVAHVLSFYLMNII